MTDQSLENIEPFVLPHTELEKKVALVAAPIVFFHGCELVHIKIGNQKKNAKVLLYIDELETSSSVTLDKLEFLNRLIGDVLDVVDAEKQLFSNSYELEVSSPGLNRPLAKKSHFEVMLGRLVRLKIGSQGKIKTLIGRLVSINELCVIIKSGSPEEMLQISWSALNDAHVVYEFPNKNVGKISKKVP
jgi:ribosome maturation factor RimP